VNTKAKRRAQSLLAARDEVEPEDVPVDAKPLVPLAAPEGQQVFDVEAASAGQRLDRFLGQAAAARRVALSRRRRRNRPSPARTSSSPWSTRTSI
jgi:hypothetical protein